MARPQELGREAEAEAARLLEGLGYTILERGWRHPLGQIDLIAKDGDTVVFVEVKARTSRAFGTPEEGLTERQKRRLQRAASMYLQRLGGDWNARFDVIAFDSGSPRHHKDAFRPS